MTSAIPFEVPRAWDLTRIRPDSTLIFDAGALDHRDHVLITYETKWEGSVLSFDTQVEYLRQQIIELGSRMVETNVSLLTLNGKFGNGVYYIATEKNWDYTKNGWPVMMRSVYQSKTMNFELTVLCNDKDSATIQEALDFLRNQK